MTNVPKFSDTRRALIEKYLSRTPPDITGIDTTHRHRRRDVCDPRVDILALQTGGTKQPFFFMHGHFEGDASYCFPIAHELGPLQPFYVLSPYEFRDLPVPPTFETTAAAHLALLRDVQPEGPYYLGGFCNGGLMAYEMARQLQAQGEKFDLLVLIDPVWIKHFARYRLLHGLITSVGKLIRQGEEKQLNYFLLSRYFYRYATSIWRHLRYRYSEKTESGEVGFISLFPTAQVLHNDYEGIYYWAVLDYIPSPLKGKITLLWSHKCPYRKGWQRTETAGEGDVHVFPCDQPALQNDYLRTFAKILHSYLLKAQIENNTT